MNRVENASNVPSTVRLSSIDAYRGFVMLLMMAEVLHCGKVAKAIPDNPIWSFLGCHQSHVPWRGCTLHDLIQPSFSFLVGVALPFSLAHRRARGLTLGRVLVHAGRRSFVLISLGIFLRSIGKPQTNFTFEDTLTQIGLGYFFLVLLGLARVSWQWLALALILIGYWASFALYPLPPADFEFAAVDVPSAWPHHLTGLAARWNKNTNLGWAADRWFLNLFPRETPFLANDGGYATLSFIPTLGTMILGLLAGGLLRRDDPPGRKVTLMVIMGILGLILGWSLDASGLCPIVKRIWRPSWVLFSGGWCFLFLAGLYAVLDVAGWQAWAFPLRVIGMNSITAYCLDHLIEDFLLSSLATHFGPKPFQIFGSAFEPFLTGAAVLAVYWLILYWLYRRGLFLRI
jgi:predicted acyltransferase